LYSISRGLKQVNRGEYNSPLMTNYQLPITKLEEKLQALQSQLFKLESEGMEDITRKRIEADMGDDFRENEGAKLVMDDHNMHNVRRWQLKREILELKKRIIRMKNS